MKITAALAADLAVLSKALDEPGRDLAADLLQFATNARSVAPSFVGVTVSVKGREPPFSFITFEDGSGPSDVRASLLLKLVTATQSVDGVNEAEASVVLYAATAGAFVELAADLVALSPEVLVAVLIDQHLAATPLDSAVDLAAESAINQAVGVLIGSGHSQDEARAELDRRAAAAGTDRRRAAEAILAGLGAASDPGPVQP